MEGEGAGSRPQPIVADAVVAQPGRISAAASGEEPTADGSRPRHLVRSLEEDARSELPADAASGRPPALDRRRRLIAAHSFNPRLLSIRLLSAGLTAILTVAITPWLRFESLAWWKLLVVAVLFGVLNALVKPILQFLMLRFIVGSYGVVVVLINVIVLWLLDKASDGIVVVENVGGLLIGGLLLGVIGAVFDTLLGVNPPMLDHRFSDALDAT